VRPGQVASTPCSWAMRQMTSTFTVVVCFRSRLGLRRRVRQTDKLSVNKSSGSNHGDETGGTFVSTHVGHWRMLMDLVAASHHWQSETAADPRSPPRSFRVWADTSSSRWLSFTSKQGAVADGRDRDRVHRHCVGTNTSSRGMDIWRSGTKAAGAAGDKCKHKVSKAAIFS
jgi:hypothetical protein